MMYVVAWLALRARHLKLILQVHVVNFVSQLKMLLQVWFAYREFVVTS